MFCSLYERGVIIVDISVLLDIPEIEQSIFILPIGANTSII